MRAFAFVVALLVAAPAFAQSSAITVSRAWVMTPPPAAAEASAFVTIAAAHDDRLLSVSCECAASAQLHEMRMDGSMMSMNPLRYGAPVPAQGGLAMGPHGVHIMLSGLTAPLAQGQRVALRLTFRDAGTVIADAEVRRRR